MPNKQGLFASKESIKQNFWVNSGRQASSSSATVQLRVLAKISKVGSLSALVGCTLLYGWDQYEQHKTRVIFNTTKPKGQATLKTTTAVCSEDLDAWEYSEENDLVQRYGSGAMVRIGGGRKEGFRGILSLPGFMESSEEVRSTPLDKAAVCHVGLVIEPADGDKKSRPLLIGRQSPKGPLPTLMSAIQAGWEQFVNPDPTLTVCDVMKQKLQTTIANESPHIAKGTAFDTMVIADLAIPVEFVQAELRHAHHNLSSVMTFVTDNCMTTKSYILLRLVKRVDEWANSGANDAPPREKADAFITGCYEIIAADIHSRGYGVLNNPQVAHQVEESGQVAKKVGRVAKEGPVAHGTVQKL